MAEGGGLLNRYTLLRRIEGSNPSVSARDTPGKPSKIGPKPLLSPYKYGAIVVSGLCG